MSLRKITLLILFLVAVLWLPVGSMMAQIFSGTNKTRVMGRANRGPNYFAIMGHIKHPMAYQLPTSAPSLVDFIRFAGGALKSTTGEVRVVRGGRIAQQTMLTANSTIKLMPGDLVIIDGGRGGRGKIFRGGSNRDGGGGDSERLHQIALIGVQPYPVIMQMTPDVATKRWILQQLRQDLSIASSVKVVSRRHFGAPPGIDTRLTDNSVLYFADGLINTAALPRLPGPFRAGVDRRPGQQAPTSNQPSAPSAAAQLPLPITQPLPDSAAETPARPGYTDMPDARESAEASTTDPEATREILTHPGSVPLDERQPTLPGRAHVGDTGSAKVGRPAQERTAPAPRDDSSIRFNQDAIPESNPQEQPEGRSEAEAPSSEFVAPEAVKPFVSQPDRGLTPVLPESANPEAAPRPETVHGDETSALPLTPVAPGEKPAVETPRHSSPAVETPSAPDRVELLNPPASEPAASAEPKVRPDTATSVPRAIPVPEAEKRATPAPSLAAQSADELANSLREKASEKTANPNSAEKEVSTGVVVEATPKEASVFTHGNGGGSRIVPHKDEGTSWPLIAAGFIGSLGFLAAFSLLLSMTGPAPPTPTRAAKTDREWLDDIINDDLPIEEEPAAEPAVSELFGRPTDAPVLRLDAKHREVPRPHFLDRGHQTGVGQPRAPQPDMPEPEDKQPDDKPDQTPIVVPPRRTDPPSRTPDVPLAPAAAEPAATGTAVLEPASGIVEQLSRKRPRPKKQEQKPHLGRKIVRIDSTHGAGVPSKKPVGQPASKVVSNRETESEVKISVQPAKSVEAGSDLLDRILARVEPQKNQTDDEQQTGRRGQKEQS